MTQAEALLSEEEYITDELSLLVDPTEPRSRHLKVAPAPQPGSRFKRVPVAVGITLTVMALFGIVAANVVMAQQSFSLDETASRHRDAVRLNAELRAEVAGLSSPERIVAEAEALGMVPATGFEFVQGTKRSTPAPASDDAAKTLRDTSGQARD